MARTNQSIFKICKKTRVTSAPFNAAVSMPFVVRSDSENEAELVFLSPDEEPERPKSVPGAKGDQGASPSYVGLTVKGNLPLYIARVICRRTLVQRKKRRLESGPRQEHA